MYVCFAFMDACTAHVSSTHGGQVLESLELELQMVSSFHVGAVD